MSGHAAPSPGWELPRLRPPVLARAAVAFVVTLTAWFLLREAYTRVLLGAAEPVLAAMAGPEKGPVFEWRNGKPHLRIEGLPESPDRPRLRELRVHTVHWNLVLAGTLFLATPLARLRRSPGRIAVAALVLFASHVAHVALSVLVTLAVTFEERGIALFGAAASSVLSTAILLMDAVVSPVLPFALWAFVAGRGGPSGMPLPDSRVGRNDPCPCGSGRKFKRCCGRS